MTIANVSSAVAAVAAVDADPIALELAELRARARRIGAELAEIYARLGALDEQIRRHRERR